MSIIKKSLDLTIVSIGQQVLNLLFIFMISHNYKPEYYADYRQTFLPFEVISPLLTFSLPAAVFYFYPKYINKLKLLAVLIQFSIITVLAFGLFIFIGGANFLAGIFDNNISDYLYAVPFFALASIGIALFQSYLVLENRTTLLLKVNIPVIILALFMLTFGIYEGWQLEKLIYLRIAVYIINFLLLIFLIFKDDWQALFDINIDDYGRVLKFCSGLTIASVIGTISYELDKIIVSSFDSPQNFAVYINGAFELPLISVVTGAVSSAMLAKLSPLIHENKLADAAALFRQTILLTTQFIIPVFIFAFINSEEIIILLFGKQYHESITPFRIYLLLLPIRVIFYGQALIALGKSNTILKRGVVELFINLILSLILFNIIGFYGVAVATVISILCWTVPYNLHVIKKGFGVRLFDLVPAKEIVYIFLVSLILFLPLDLLTKSFEISDLYSIILEILLGVPVYLLFVYKLRLLDLSFLKS